jgi:hypothetical protein
VTDEEGEENKILELVRDQIQRKEHGGADLDQPKDEHTLGDQLLVLKDGRVRFEEPAWMAGLLALILVAVFCAVCFGSLVLITFSGRDADAVARALGIVLGSLGGLVGAVSGFYFGGSRPHAR